MPYQTEAFGEALRQARLRKGWSQRTLSERAGLPQPHVSRIENGTVDLKLSTLMELARLLDLEPVLVPRAALLAVRAVIRADAGTEAERPAYSVDDED